MAVMAFVSARVAEAGIRHPVVDGTRPGVSTPEDRQLAQALLDRTMNTYRNYNRGAFSDMVDGDYPKDRMLIVNRAESSYYSAAPAQIDYFINTVNRTGDKLAVSFNWEKKSMVRSTGRQRNDRGGCLFVYRKSGDKWLLYDIRGRSPF